MEKRHIAGKLGGGIQTVERLHAELLYELGHEVLFLTTADSDDAIFPHYPEIKIVKLQSGSEESYESEGEIDKVEKGRLNKKKTAEIRATIKRLEPAAIINHSFSSSHVKLCAELSATIPVLCVIHNTPETAGDMSMFAKLQGYRDMTLNGSTLVCVSKHQRNLWRKLIHRRYATGSEHFAFIKSADEIDKIFDNVCYSTAINADAPKIVSPDDYFMVIGRPEKDKNIGKLLEGMTFMDNPPKVKVYIAFGGELEDYDYYNEQIKPHLGNPKLAGVTFHCNAPRVELLRDLSKARGLFVTCPVESSPVAPLEAGTYGIPSIVFCKTLRDGTIHHACFDTLGKDYFVQALLKRSKDFGVVLDEVIQDPRIDSMTARQEIQTEVIRRHSRDARLAELHDTLNTTLDRYKDKKVVSINSLLAFE
jgi:glycosyltransferase involved in cell wall biosynthesis